jgi:N-acetylornithine carbamoyltransferase
MAALRGMEVVVLRPEGYGLPGPVLERVRRAAALAGGSLRETDDRAEALAGAHVLYAKSWTAPARYGDPAGEAELRAGLRSWCVDEGWFAPAAPGCRFLHCLPVRRNVVVRDEVLDGPRSAVVREAHNRMWTQMALLHRLLGGGGGGRRARLREIGGGLRALPAAGGDLAARRGGTDGFAVVPGGGS